MSKHLTLNDRIDIQMGLKEKLSFNEISKKLGKDPSTISKEIRNNRVCRIPGAYNPCANSSNCPHKGDLCRGCPEKRKVRCSRCTHLNCYEKCEDFKETKCIRYLRYPYVCNSCPSYRMCRLEKHVYDAKAAQQQYETKLKESREGVNLTPAELERLDTIITPLIKRGQSIHHIFVNNKDILMVDERTIYSYIEMGMLTAGSMDLPRKVRYRKRKQETKVRIDKKCHIDRTYEDFIEFCNENPGITAAEMDSVEGTHDSTVTLLTIILPKQELVLAFVREANTARSVKEIFESLDNLLGRELFCKLFPAILTDRGSEFTDPLSIEFGKDDELRTKVFYCNPGRPDQKGSIEVAHEMIRRVLPKKTSFKHLTQQDVNTMLSHINSYTRKQLGDKSAYQMFVDAYGAEPLKKLGIREIAPNDIKLKADLLR